MSSVRVLLDHNFVDACYPGQTIVGKVECNFDEEITLRAVRIKFRGRAKTEWYRTESHGSGKNRRSRRVRYSAEESYFDAEYNLIEGGDNFSLSAGKHVYPFSYILPPQLPSCYEASHGNIRYYIKATVDRPWKFDYDDRISLNLVSPLDLNYLPSLREPVNTSVDKSMCSCWCNDSGRLTFNMSLPATGFVPGQEINIGCHIENMTNVNAENVKFKVVAQTEFISHYPSTRTTYERAKITECRESGVGAHGEKSWTSCMIIPVGHFSNLNPCSIMNIDYTLQATVVVPCPHTDLDNEIAITIGSIPLSAVATSFPVGLPAATAYPLPPGPIHAGTPLLPTVPVPYPGGIAPYPPGGSAPYPPGGSAPYPPSGGDTKYPPGANVSSFGEKSPSAPPGDTPYPSGGAPYPPRNGEASAPSAFGGASYPPAEFALPSYDEAQKSKEKNEKPE